MKPTEPPHERVPLHVPNEFVIVHDWPPPETSSSIRKSQSSSLPLHVSATACGAVHADHPVAGSHVWVPKHVPTALAAVHERVPPVIPAVHVQLPSVGWQNMPACVPLPSAVH